MDIAKLGLEVDARGVIVAKKKLDELEVSGAKVEKRTTQMCPNLVRR